MKISIVIDINVTCMPMLYLMSLFFFLRGNELCKLGASVQILFACCILYS